MVRAPKRAKWQPISIFTGKAAFGITSLGVEHSVDALETARAELVVVLLVARGGAGEHDVIAVLSARRAVAILFGVVLITSCQSDEKSMS